MEYKDYYKLMGLSKTASVDEIKKQYRKMARKYHPDVNSAKDAEQKFKDIGEAYEVLKDSKKRKAYDQYGQNWKEGQQQQQYERAQSDNFGAGGGFEYGSGFEDSGQFSDFFESIFGGRRNDNQSRNGSFKGEDINASILIPIKYSYTGSTRQISIQIPGAMSAGQASVKNVNLNVKIPKGIKNGQKIRLVGQGSPGHNSGQPGDLYIKIEFIKEALFYTKGADVYINLPVNAWEAALGCAISVPTPISAIKVNIPPGTAHGKKLRIKGKGIPAKEPGDLFVVVNIVLPPAESASAKKVYEEMKQLNFDPRKNIKR